MSTVNLTVRLDRDVKEQSEALFSDFGMTLSTAINVFLRQTLRKGAIPFEIGDSFYSERNQRRLHESIAQYKSGNVVVKTMRELEAMENE